MGLQRPSLLCFLAEGCWNGWPQPCAVWPPGVCLLYGQRFIGSNTFFRTTICAALISGLALLLVTLGLGKDLEAISIGALMVLVPGMALTNAMREIMAGDVFSGLNRTAEVILVATAIALGTALPLLLGQGAQGGGGGQTEGIDLLPCCGLCWPV